MAATTGKDYPPDKPISAEQASSPGKVKAQSSQPLSRGAPSPEQPQECRACPHEHACRGVWATESRGTLQGGSLVGAALAGFVLPLFCGVGGGVILGRWAPFTENTIVAQVAGFLVGGMIGLLPARAIVNRLHRAAAARQHRPAEPAHNRPPDSTTSTTNGDTTNSTTNNNTNDQPFTGQGVLADETDTRPNHPDKELP